MRWKEYLDYKDIRFWLVFFFIIRLYAITLPPLEFQHAWRQTDGLMITRNFYETLPNIFFPMVDIAGDKTGITGSEFPLLNYLSYFLCLIFGYQHWYGRLIVLIASTVGCFYFYKTIKKFFDEKVAFNATIFLTASYWFSYSRKIFPDCFAAGLCMIALYFVLEYLENGKIKHLIFYLLLGSFACLSKISSALLLSVLAIPILSSKYPIYRKISTCIASSVIIICIAGWYFVWVPYLNKTFGYGDHFLMGYPLSEGWLAVKNSWKDILWRLFIVPMKYMGLIIFVGSLIYILYKRLWLAFAVFIIPYLFFLLIIVKTGISIIDDQYYVLMSIPLLAFVAGFGSSKIPNKIVMAVLLAATAIENIGDQINDFRVHRTNKFFQDLEAITDSVSKRDDLFIINTDEHCPTAMYFAHRKGWVVSSRQLKDPGRLEDVKGKGCKFVLICKQLYGNNIDVTLDLPQVFESEFFRIYSLENLPTVENKKGTE